MPAAGGPPAGPAGSGRNPRQVALLVAAGLATVAIVVVAVILATHSSHPVSTTTASLPPATEAPPATTPAATTTAASTTIATAAPATSPSTTAVSETTIPVVAPTAPTPQQALNSIVATLGPAYSVSAIGGQDRQQYVAVDHPAAQPTGGRAVVVDIYLYVNGGWAKQATIPLGADGSTGLLLRASQDATPITVAAVTGAATPDYMVTTTGASSLITTVVSDQTGTWRAVPFDTPSGALIGVPGATVEGSRISAVFNTCTPTCAQGSSHKMTFSYQGETFVAASA